MTNFVEAIHKLLTDKKILAYHDRSDGGLITTLIEMSFASRLGLEINLDSVLEDNNKLVDFLFNEELGVVIQVNTKDLDYVYELLDESSLKHHSHNLGCISTEKEINFSYKDKKILSFPLKVLIENWHKVGFEIQSLRDNPITAEAEFRHDSDINNLGLSK